MPTASVSFIIHFARVLNLAVHHNVGTCLRHVSMQSAIVSTPWKHATNHKPKGRFFWFVYAKGIPKVTMFAVEMWFGVGEGVECGRSTGLCPLPLGVPRCVIHNKKNVGTKFLVILKNNYKNHQNHSNNAKKQKNFQRTKHLHRD